MMTPFLFDIVSYTVKPTRYDFRAKITVFGANQAYFELIDPVGKS